MHRYRFALRPGWWALHVFTLALVVTMVLLGRWQLIVSDEKHFNIRNFGYALQWWAFTLFTGYMWVRVLRDHARHDDAVASGVADPVVGTTEPAAADEPVAYRRYVAPTVAQDQDDHLASYNDYLARLHSTDGERS